MKKRWQPLKYPLVIYIFLILSLCLNLYFLVSPGFKDGVLETAGWQQLKEIMEPGTYGPSDLEIVEGPLRISAPGVKLQNTRVKGDLILTAAIGDGCADLVKVCVEDRVLVQGGGEDTVVIEDGEIKHLVINRDGGKVRVVLKGSSIVEKITIQGESCLSTSELSDEGRVGELSVETAEEIELEGDFDAVFVAEPEARITFLGGEAGTLGTGEEAGGAVIALKEGAVIASLEAGAPLELTGEGTVGEITVGVAGLFKISGMVEKVSAAGRGIFLEFGPGSVGTLLVEPSEGTVMVHLAQGAAVKYMELNGAAGVTGGGGIELARINAPGVNFEQSPGHVELAKGIKAVVEGKEVTADKPKEETAGKEPTKDKPKSPDSSSPSTPTPKPATPTVSIDSISSREIRPGQSITISITTVPADASITVSSSNNNIAGVSLSGRSINIQGVDTPGTATITVKASKSGYKESISTFKVTMDPIDKFVPGEIALKTMVAISLKYSDPQNYIVYVGGIKLTYDPAVGGFEGEVPKSDAVLSNVRVRRK